MRSKRMIFSVAAMLVAAVLALSACGGQEAPAPEETAEQQVLFDVTRFIGVDEAGLVAIMGEPDDVNDYELDGDKVKDYNYSNITYEYNGDQNTFYVVGFLLRQEQDEIFGVEQLDIGLYNSLDEAKLILPMDTDMLALFGITPTNIEINEKASREYLNPIEGIRFFNTTIANETDDGFLLDFVTVGY
jgi:hypothetical protein